MKLIFLNVLFAAACVVAAPTDLKSRQITTIFPSATNTWNVPNGPISNVNPGLVFKSLGQSDKTTLLAFTIPDVAAGKRCTISFAFDSSVSVSGSQIVQMFTSNWSANYRNGVLSGNSRDKHIGTASFSSTKMTWTSDSPLLYNFICPAAGTVVSFEIVGVSDTVNLSWNPTSAGFRLTVS